jgi:hypothetical protein
MIAYPRALWGHVPGRGGTVWRGTTAFVIADGRIAGVFNQLNPARLDQAGLDRAKLSRAG